MDTICTEDPEQLWEYYEPAFDGGEIHVVKSEQEIFESYFPWWSGRMEAIGKKDLISRANCIDDWIIVNWANKAERD